ncbi:MAG TPA: hypothetical protein VFG08_05990 [Candidatus Polarisedimenticolia bacterium]|nr:hypothetical protein [Candidatus Polarisedimenticolia bacterium]
MPRFRCLTCRRTFSLQSFAFSYYLKRPDLSVPIAAGLLAGSAHRQIARSLACAPSTVTRRAARLGRHAILFSSQVLQHLPGLTEPAVVDHFESFAVCQDDPVGVATVVGHRSWFVYALDPAPHRRGGRMTPAQRRRARRRPRPPAGSYLRSFTRVLDFLVERGRGTGDLDLITDDHPAYGVALARHPQRQRIRHQAFRNPPRGPKGAPRSAEARRRDRAMFPVDLLHALMRHSCAHHRRETIAFSRRLNALLERGFLLAVWRNFVKARSERRSGEITPAMQLGLTRQRWAWGRVLAQRVFPSRTPAPPEWMRIYRREWEVAHVPPATRHALKLAF